MFVRKAEHRFIFHEFETADGRDERIIEILVEVQNAHIFRVVCANKGREHTERPQSAQAKPEVDEWGEANGENVLARDRRVRTAHRPDFAAKVNVKETHGGDIGR